MIINALLHEKDKNTNHNRTQHNAPATMAKEQAERPVYTKDKAVHLIRVYSAIVSMLLLIGWMHLTLLKPLKTEVIEMVRSSSY
jgi:hypothetical protein